MPNKYQTNQSYFVEKLYCYTHFLVTIFIVEVIFDRCARWVQGKLIQHGFCLGRCFLALPTPYYCTDQLAVPST